MRIRSVKPEFFRDSKVLDLPPLARLLFIGLWCCADREGRMRYEPRELRLQILPEENRETFESMIADIYRNGLLTMYEVGTVRYLSINNFHKHQLAHYKEKPSAIPSPAEGEPSSDPVLTQCSPSSSRSVLGAVNGVSVSSSKTQKKPHRASRGFSSARFEEFWKAFPSRNGLKRGKAAAGRYWKDLGCEENAAAIMASLEAQRRHHVQCEIDGVFVAAFPDPERWLKNSRWADEVRDEPAATPEPRPVEKQNRLVTPEERASLLAKGRG